MAGNDVQTIYDVLRAAAERGPDAPAVLAPGRAPLTHARLLDRVHRTAALLRDRGLGAADRVALVAQNGPDAATAFLSVACVCACAPLDPACTPSEFRFYLRNLRVRALLAEPGLEAAAAVAGELGLPVIPLAAAGDAAPGTQVPTPGPADVALTLHTSGTTGRPRVVPLTHANICACARATVGWLQLTPDDRCLNIMPLFHVHGLLTAVFASLAAGGSVVCAPGLRPESFFEWARQFQPTWYTASPALHHAVMAALARRPDAARGCAFRFIRSAAAPLPPALMHAMEEAFGVPVIESYGMTEAAPQITSNPLPPGVRKPGSAGLPAGPQVAILDADGRPLPPGTQGEIAIRGPSVVAGYEGDARANADAFAGGWLHTGDLGHLDADGYLFITGRLKEVINRGGELVGPREVDEALLQHPDVEEAAAFGVPHPTLGEDVAAVVRLRAGARTGPAELRAFAARLLAPTRVPSRILVVDAIPKGPSGKVQRLALAEGLRARLESAYTPPQTAAERRLARIWRDALEVRRVGRHDDFFALGGSSLSAVRVLSGIERQFGVRLSPATLFAHPVLADLAALAVSEERRSDEPVPGTGQLVRVAAGGRLPPLVMVSLGFGWEAHSLARHLDAGQPVYTLRLPPLDRRPTDSAALTDRLAGQLAGTLRRELPGRPCVIAGGCAGGVLAFETARRLLASGGRVPLLALFDVDFPPPLPLPFPLNLWLVRWPLVWGRLRRPGAWQALREALGGWLRHLRGRPEFEDVAAGPDARCMGLYGRERGNLWRYRPRPYPGRVAIFTATGSGVSPLGDRRLLWRRVIRGPLELHRIPGEHERALREPHVVAAAGALQAAIRRAVRQAEAAESTP